MNDLFQMHFRKEIDTVVSFLSLKYNTDVHKNRSSSVSFSTYVKIKDY